MALLSSVTLGELIDDSLEYLYRDAERPRTVVLGADALASVSDTSFTLATSGDWEAVEPLDVLENGRELVVVTAKSSDATPVFTAVRGQLGTTDVRQTAASGAVLTLNPQWTRLRVQKAIERCLRRAMPVTVPSLTTTQVQVGQDKRILEVPATAIDVKRVAWYDTERGEWFTLDGWEFVDDVPVAISSTGKMVTLHQRATRLGNVNGGNVQPYFQVTYQVPYSWETGGTSPASEADEIELPMSALDVPVLYAAAYLHLGRELTRLELDRVEEWNQDQAMRQGANLRLVKTAWDSYYQAIDDVRRTQTVPRHRPFRKMRKI